MKKCPNCAQQNSDASQFCENCGAFLGTTSFMEKIFDFLSNSGKLTQEFSPAEVPPSNAHAQKLGEKHSKVFIAQDETIQAAIGVGYVQNYMSGAGFKNGAAILTDKRLYYFGRSFSSVGRGTNTTTEEGIVSVDEITFTRFVHGSPLSYLVTAIIFFLLGLILFGSVVGTSSEFSGVLGAIGLVLAFLGIVFFAAYFAGRCTVLEIAFPGGKYCFNSRWHSAESMREFQRQIHMVKDSLKANQNAKAEVSQ